MIHLIMELYLFIKKEVLYFVNMYKQNKGKKTSKLTRPKEPIGDRCIMSEREDYIQKIKYRLDILERYEPGRYTSCLKKYSEPGSDKPTILFLDDIVGTNILYESDMKKIKLRYEKDVKNDFNIMFCFGGTCAETLIEEFVRKDIRIDYALLDITIKTIFKIDCDTAMEVDGVDLALLLMKYNHDIKIIFATGHTLNKYNKTMQEYINKFEFGTGKNILDHYLNKNATDRVTPIYKLLYEGTGDEHRN